MTRLQEEKLERRVSRSDSTFFFTDVKNTYSCTEEEHQEETKRLRTQLMSCVCVCVCVRVCVRVCACVCVVHTCGLDFPHSLRFLRSLNVSQRRASRQRGKTEKKSWRLKAAWILSVSSTLVSVFSGRNTVTVTWSTLLQVQVFVTWSDSLSSCWRHWTRSSVWRHKQIK